MIYVIRIGEWFHYLQFINGTLQEVHTAHMKDYQPEYERAVKL